MESKIFRLDNALSNMQFAIKYYLNDLDNNYSLKKISTKEYNITSRNLREISFILRSLKEQTSFSDKKLEEIRVLNLEIATFFEDDDYSLIYGEIIKTNNELCSGIKDIDRKRINNFKKIFNTLTPFYQYRLRKAEVTENGLSFKDKKHDNFLFISENYLGIKYNFKKVKYNVLSINNKYLDECNKIIYSNECDSNVKHTYINIKNYLNNCLKYELLLNNLSCVKSLCDEKPYFNILKLVNELFLKYSNLFEENKLLLHDALANQKLVNIDDDLAVCK